MDYGRLAIYKAFRHPGIDMCLPVFGGKAPKYRHLINCQAQASMTKCVDEANQLTKITNEIEQAETVKPPCDWMPKYMQKLAT
jgi:hypothetical protein